MKSSRTPNIVIGIALILFSLFILVRLLTKLDATTNIIDYWPAFLILLGVLTINPKNPNSNGVSMGIIGLGTFGLLYRVGTFQTPQGQTLLAVMLGFVGLVILITVVARPKKQKNLPDNTAQYSSQQTVSKSNRE